MPWSRKFTEPITLKDGLTLSTLADALAFVLSQTDQEQLFWRYAAELLADAAANGDERTVEDARAQLMRALKAERLI